MHARLLPRYDFTPPDADLPEPHEVIDCIFFDGAVSLSPIAPWEASGGRQWPWDWLPKELKDRHPHSAFRIFSVNYRIRSSAWEDQFVLLETSEECLHLFKKAGVGTTHHRTIFFAWGFDILLMKQILMTGSITHPEVRLSPHFTSMRIEIHPNPSSYFLVFVLL